MTLISKINRQSSQSAKKRLFWCSRCDHEKNGQHGKCWNCGHRETQNKRSIKNAPEVIDGVDASLASIPRLKVTPTPTWKIEVNGSESDSD